MVKWMEIALMLVTLSIVLGLVVAGQPEAPPASDHAVGAQEIDEESRKAS